MKRPYTLIALAILIFMGISEISHKTTEWDRVYRAAAGAMVRGRDILAVRGYAYPPFSALVNIPLALLPARAGRAIFFIILAGCLVYYMRKSWRLSGGAKLENNPALPSGEHFICILGLACAGIFALNSLTHLQTDLLIAALLTAGVAEIAGGRFIRSAVWIGLAAAFKLTPLLFAPYLLWRRKWLAAILLLMVTISANLLPSVVRSPPGGGIWLGQWYQRYLRPMGKSDYDPGYWQNELNNNQSLAGTVRRWFATRLGGSAVGYNAVDLPNRPEPAVLRRIFLGGAVLVLLPVAYVLWRRRKGYPPDSPAPDRRMLECGVVMLLMLIFSPNSSPAHYCIMLLPAFCAARAAVRGSDRLVRFLMTMTVICCLLSIHIRLRGTMRGEQFLLWLGIDVLAALFLMWTCLAILARERARPDHSASMASP